MPNLYETILPSGKAIRLEQLYTKEYREAMRRAGAKGLTGVLNTESEIAHELLMGGLRAITAMPVDIVMTKVKAKDGKEIDDLDLDKTLEKVSPAAWQALTYEMLVTEGPSSLYELLKDPADYETACLFATQVIASVSPLGRMAANKKRVVSTG